MSDCDVIDQRRWVNKKVMLFHPSDGYTTPNFFPLFHLFSIFSTSGELLGLRFWGSNL